MSDLENLNRKIQHVVNIARNTSQDTFATSVYVVELLEIFIQEEAQLKAENEKLKEANKALSAEALEKAGAIIFDSSGLKAELEETKKALEWQPDQKDVDALINEVMTGFEGHTRNIHYPSGNRQSILSFVKLSLNSTYYQALIDLAEAREGSDETT